MQEKLLFSESYEKFADKYERRDHSVGVSMWEFEWCPKYRYKMFRKWKYRKLVEACVRRAATENGIKWLELNVQPDHLHGTAVIPMTMSPSIALQLLKGRSAFLFFRNHPDARKRYPKGHLWSRGKFSASLGFIQVEVANNYIRNQDRHHGTVWIIE
ncbi:IS200/IS605 family transposase [Candidatus Pacearchaeota archaeon]|nr:IS200/IS605 family transposase [Candidatus Pacearchaeota archaeon]